MSQDLACIILAAGKGSRMKSEISKPLHKIAHKPMIRHIIDACSDLNADKIITVISPDTPDMEQAVSDHHVAIQPIANGTGGAMLAACDLLKDFKGNVLMIFGDTPLITSETLQKMIDVQNENDDTDIVCSAFTCDDPTGYGRMDVAADGSLSQIIEHKDCTAEQLQINLCNGGIMCINGAHLFNWLDQVTPNNAQGEYYAVDLPKIAKAAGYKTRLCLIDQTEIAGVNSRVHLAALEEVFQNRMRQQMLENGVTLIDPKTVYFAADTKIGRDVIIHPHVIFGPNVCVKDNANIHAFSHLEGATVHEGASIGPYARLRPGSDIGEHAKVGNFVEIKKTTLGTGAKVSHLSYLGDASIGDHVNIGAGTITCNYDGFQKYQTRIDAGAFIGSNTSLVAPVHIGQDAMIGAGSIVTKDVGQDALALSRADQTERAGWAKKFKTLKTKSKT